MSATITKGGTLPDTGVTKSEVYALVDSATITGISSTEITGSLDFTRTDTTTNILSITGSSLTTGALGYFYSNSTSTGTRNLISIVNDNTLAAGTTCLSIQQDGDGVGIAVNTLALTLQGLAVTGNYLTTGVLGYFYSNSASTGTRNLVSIINDHASAIGSQCLYLNQDADSTTSIQAMTIDQGGVTDGCSFIDFVGAAEAGVTKPISTHTTIGAYAGSIQVEINGAKEWIPYYGNPSS